MLVISMVDERVEKMLSKEEIENFNDLLAEFLFLRLKKDLLKEISEIEGKKAQRAYWTLTKSETWKALCKKYNSEKANSALTEIYDRMFDLNEQLLEVFVSDLLNCIFAMFNHLKQILVFPSLNEVEEFLIEGGEK